MAWCFVSFTSCDVSLLTGTLSPGPCLAAVIHQMDQEFNFSKLLPPKTIMYIGQFNLSIHQLMEKLHRIACYPNEKIMAIFFNDIYLVESIFFSLWYQAPGSWEILDLSLKFNYS